MWFRSVLKSPTLSSRRTSKRSRKRGPDLLRLERLEDLSLPSFLTPVTYGVGTAPQAVISADFTNDGHEDLAVANYMSGTISVLPGNANGTFQPGVTSDAGGSPLSLAEGDFDLDGNLDVVVANAFNVSVLLGNGNGTFQAPSSIDIGSEPASVAVGDFNADGRLDLGVTSNLYIPGWWGYYGWYPGYYEGMANVLLGSGTGSFAAPATTDIGYGFHTTSAVGDFNNDTHLDFVAGNSWYGNLVTLLGTGAGTLGTSYWTWGVYPGSMAADDLNGDGNLDLVVGSQYNSSVTLLVGNGLGYFTGAPQVFAIDSTPLAVAIADFNGDGTSDLVATSWGGKVNVLLGAGGGTYRPPMIVSAGGDTPAGVTVADFNGDGRQDVVTANAGSNDTSALLNDGVWPALSAPSISINDVTVWEGNTGTTNATFTVSLSAASTQSVSVHFATEDYTATVADNDYQATSGTVTFAPGETTRTVSVPIIGDRDAEYYEAFVLALTDSTNAFIADSRGFGTIADDEPRVSIDYGPVIVNEGNSGSTTAVFTVRLENAYDVPVSVNYSTFEGDTDFPGGWGYYGYYPPATADVDFQSATSSVIFAPGETEKTIPVAVYGDVVGEPDYEYYSVNLTGSDTASLTWVHAVGIIRDDEPRASINSSSAVEGDSGTTAMTFTVTLNTAPLAPVTVNYRTWDGSAQAGSDYQSQTGSVSFAIGETSKTFTVPVIGDRIGEYDEYFYVELTGAIGGGIANGWGSGSIRDNEPRIRINDVSLTEGDKGTTLMTFTVSLAAAYDQTVTVHYETQNGSATAGSDYVATSGTLTFAAGETTKTFTVAIKGDHKRESNEYFYVFLSNNSANSLIEDSYGIGTILNDDGRRN
jgi:Calx-beta domain-containing protein/VCBS repeat protein/FG-GAP repeat protein